MDHNKMSPRKNSLNILKLIQPDLMPVEELVDVLRERSVPPDLLNQQKDQLVSLFRRVALPLPQREHRQNYRGILLTKLQKKAERLKISTSPTKDTKSYTVGISGKPSLSECSKEDNVMNDRLKPPPDLINYQRKTIRLKRISGASEQSSSELDKIVIKKHKYSDSSDCGSDHNNLNITKEPTEGCISSQAKNATASEGEIENLHSKAKSNGTNSKKPAKVSLKRNHLTSEMPRAEPETSESEVNNKRKPITWP
uniref:Uncharacterized protein n=1 Tax=Graphocephala atropunctata TaxID=36148 RepID=A0A1B6MAC6_9HEMI